jgi:hypothetical protein
MTRKTRMVRVTGRNVVPFHGVKLRRVLSVESNPHPPKGLFGKAALKPKLQAPNYYPHECRPEHKKVRWEDLHPNQRLAYQIWAEGQLWGAGLTDWELNFLWSIAGQNGDMTEKQGKVFVRLYTKVRRPSKTSYDDAG